MWYSDCLRSRQTRLHSERGIEMSNINNTSRGQTNPVRRIGKSAAIDDIKHFDLGNRIVSWRLVPGHTQGSVAFIDEKYNNAFDADAAPVGAWLFLQESSPLPEYIAALNDYLTFLTQSKVKYHYLGHAGTALKIKSIKQLIRCAEYAVSKPNAGIKVNSMFGPARIIFAKGTLLFCGR